jgi:hypothetical protein
MRLTRTGCCFVVSLFPLTACGAIETPSEGETRPDPGVPEATYVGTAPGVLGGDGTFPSVAVDAAGTTHAAFRGAERTPVYAECPAPCTQRNQWRSATVGTATASISPIVLDAHGRPRFVVSTSTPDLSDYEGSSGKFSYASCDVDCTTGSNWAVTDLGDAPALASSFEIVEQNPDPMVGLAIDTSDRAWVAVFTDDAAEPSISGALDNVLTVTTCGGACTDALAWTATNHSVPGHGPVHVAVDAAGIVHEANGAFGGVPGDYTWGKKVAYVEIDTNRETTQSRVLDLNVDEYLGFLRLRVDAAGHPRLLYGTARSGWGNDGLLDRMIYAWCDEDCAAQGAWSAVELPVPGGAAQAQDLVLDGSGAPHVAYSSGNFGTLGYASCTSGCNTPRATWIFQTVESTAALLDSLSPSARTPDGASCSKASDSPVMAVGLGLAHDGTPRFVDSLHACGSQWFSIGFVAP